MSDFLIMAIGSHGDVHPFVGIGRALQARGHTVRLAVNPAFETLVRRAGLAYLPIGVREDFEAVQRDPSIWHPRLGPVMVMKAIVASLPTVYDTVVANAGPATVVVGSSICIGARVAAEKAGLTMATVHLSPICIRSSHRMPVLPGGLNANWLPRFLRSHFWAGADKWFVAPHLDVPLNAFRAEKGMGPVHRVQAGWWHSPHLTIGLWPEWYFPRQPDYPEQVKLAGFPLYDEAEQSPLDEELSAWIGDDDRGDDRPIAFTPGSAMLFGHKFFATAVDACKRLGRRGLLVTRHGEQIPADLPPTVRHVPFAPFGSLLPRCGAIVHHGGIGTTAQSLRAGIPQIIMPMSHDQFDNAAICRRIGVAESVSVRRFTGRRVAKVLRKLLTSSDLTAAGRAVAEKSAQERPLDRACGMLEALSFGKTG